MLRDLAADFSVLNGFVPPEPDFESVLELSYQAQVASWWIVQPDLQWVIHPDGRVLNLPDPRANLGEGAVVLGLRTAISL